MAITDIFSRITNRLPGPSCSVCQFVESLPSDQAAELNKLMADPLIRYSDLAEQINDDPDYDAHFNGDTISRHARGRCSARVRLR